MERNWNLSLNKVLMSVALLAATATSFAASGGNSSKECGCCKERCCPVEPCPVEVPGPFAFTYPKDMGVACPNNFFVNAQFLYMCANEEGLDYAITQTDLTNHGGAAFPLSGGNVEGMLTGNHHWEWNPGVRAELGCYLNHDMWSLVASWTHIHFHEDRNTTIKGNGALIPLFIQPGANDLNLSNKIASARIGIKYDTFDVTLGKPFHASRYFIAQPLIGVRAAWIDQKFLARYAGSIGNTADGAEMNATNNFWGVGLRGGFASEYILGSGWNLFASLNAALLYSKFDVDQELPLSVVASGADIGTELDYSFYTIVPNMDISLGVAWGHYFCREKTRLGIKVAYEFHQWWKQNQLRRFYDSTFIASSEVTPKDLSIQGFSFAVQFDF